MLRHLHVRNLAVLAEATAEFGPGLNVVTGETGAGKSLVVDSLSLLAGARASTDLIRTGASFLNVTGVFQPGTGAWRRTLEDAGIACDGDELVVRREVSHSGRNRVFLNDQPATLRLLSAVAPSLLRIHGQREELGLVAPDLQRSWLDAVGGEAGDELRRRCETTYDTYADLAERLERLVGNDRLRHERLDLLNYQDHEIAAANVEAGEEVRLRREREVLRHAETILSALGGVDQLLSGDDGAASEQLARARALLEDVEGWEPAAGAWRQELEELQIRLDEVATTVRQRSGQIEADPQRLNGVEDRLSLLERLLRKYGSTTEEILDHHRRIRDELEELGMDESEREALEAETRNALEAFRRAAVELSAARARWARDLEGRIEAELGDLGLGEARFSVKLERVDSPSGVLLVDGMGVDFSRHGVDRVVFHFSPNPGEEPRPLARVASGGELARFYLTLQVVARSGGDASAATLVFDEVDAGVGGKEAAMVGRKLRRLAPGGQILAVTHQPQVASCGDRHFRVEKRISDGRTEVSVVEVEGDRRIAEVARMLGGEELTELSLSHAEELLSAAHSEVAQ